MRIAAKVRLEKETHPERFCADRACLWRVKRRDAPDTPCPKHSVRIPLPASVGEVLLDYSVRAETAAGSLRNALQICADADVARLIRIALDKIEARGAPPPQPPHEGP